MSVDGHPETRLLLLCAAFKTPEPIIMVCQLLMDGVAHFFPIVIIASTLSPLE